MSVRALERLIATRVIVAAVPGRGRQPARFDPVAVARAIIARHTAQQPRDRRELAQAKLLELRYRREARQVLDRGDVVRRGQAVAKTVSAYLVALPARMVRDGVILADREAAVEGYLRERLDELARFGDEGYLSGGDDGVDA